MITDVNVQAAFAYYTTTGEACECANPFLAKYSPRTSFPTTCTTNNDVQFEYF